MKLHQEFTVSRPIEVVWSFFKDIPAVAACLPGAEYLAAKGDGVHSGKVSAKVGPFQASFDGDAEVRYNEEENSILMEGKGVDRKGASRGKMAMSCKLEPVGQATKVFVDSDIQLSGAIAQFGRTGLVTEIANVLIADFVRNAEAALAIPDTSEPRQLNATASPSSNGRSANRPIGGFTLLVLSLKAWMRSWFRRDA